MRNCRIGLLLIAVSVVGVARAGEVWPQWGGPARNFTVEARDLSRSWAEEGPPRLWTRPLGGGFATIVSDGRRLYTMYRQGDDEIVIALDPGNGKTIWEHRYTAAIPESEALSTQYGKGPNATPLLVDGMLVTLGFTGHVRGIGTKKGKLRWEHDLGKEFDVAIPYFGHATSPLTVGRNAIVVAGGVFAFDLESGKVTWQNRDFKGSYGSPRLLEVDGREQIVTPLDAHLAGFDPATGKTLWSHEHKNQWGTILISPVIDATGRVFISAAEIGSVLVDPSAGKTDDRQVWKTDATQIAHSNAVRAGDWVFASVAGSASFIAAISLEDGRQAWKERGFAQANLLRVGDDFLVLDHDGQLALVELSESGMDVVTRASINDEPTWTTPTLIGTTLYYRDESRISALDLSVRAE